MTADQLNRVLPGVDTATPVESGAFPMILTGIDSQLEELGKSISADRTFISTGRYPFEDSLPEMARVGGKIDSPRTFDSDWEFDHSLNSVYSKESLLGIVPFEFRYGLTGVVDGEWLRLMKQYRKYWHEVWRGRLGTRQFDFIVSTLSSVINGIDSEREEMESLGFVSAIPWRYDRLWKKDQYEHLVFVERSVHSFSGKDSWNMKGKYIREDFVEKEYGKRFRTVEFSGEYDRMSDMAVAMVKRLVPEDDGLEILHAMNDRMRHETVTRQVDMDRIIREEF